MADQRPNLGSRFKSPPATPAAGKEQARRENASSSTPQDAKQQPRKSTSPMGGTPMSSGSNGTPSSAKPRGRPKKRPNNNLESRGGNAETPITLDSDTSDPPAAAVTRQKRGPGSSLSSIFTNDPPSKKQKLDSEANQNPFKGADERAARDASEGKGKGPAARLSSTPGVSVKRANLTRNVSNPSSAGCPLVGTSLGAAGPTRTNSSTPARSANSSTPAQSNARLARPTIDTGAADKAGDADRRPKALESSVATLKPDLEKMKADVKTCQDADTSLKKDVAACVQTSQELRKFEKKMKADITSLSSEQKGILQKVQTIETTTKEAAQNSESHMLKLRDDLTREGLRIDALEQSATTNTGADGNADGVPHRLENMESFLNQLEPEFKKLQGEIPQLQDKSKAVDTFQKQTYTYLKVAGDITEKSKEKIQSLEAEVKEWSNKAESRNQQLREAIAKDHSENNKATNRRIDGLEQKAGTIQTRIATLEKGFTNLNNVVTPLCEDRKKLRGEFDDVRQTVMANLDRSAKRCDGIEGRATKLSDHIMELEKKQTSTDERVTSLESPRGNNERAIANHAWTNEKRMDDLQKLVDNQKTAMDARITSVEKKTTQTSQVAKDRTATVDKRLGEMDGRIEELRTQNGVDRKTLADVQTAVKKNGNAKVEFQDFIDQIIKNAAMQEKTNSDYGNKLVALERKVNARDSIFIAHDSKIITDLGHRIDRCVTDKGATVDTQNGILEKQKELTSGMMYLGGEIRALREGRDPAPVKAIEKIINARVKSQNVQNDIGHNASTNDFIDLTTQVRAQKEEMDTMKEQLKLLLSENQENEALKKQVAELAGDKEKHSQETEALKKQVAELAREKQEREAVEEKRADFATMIREFEEECRRRGDLEERLKELEHSSSRTESVPHEDMIKKTLDGHRQAIVSYVDQRSLRLASHGNRLDAVEKQVVRLDAVFSRVDKKSEQLVPHGNRLNALEQRTKGLETRIQPLETRIKPLENQILENLRNHKGPLDSRLSELEQSSAVKDLAVEFGDFKTKTEAQIQSTEIKLSEFEKTAKSSVEEAVQAAKSSAEEATNAVFAKETNRIRFAVQEQVDKALETASANNGPLGQPAPSSEGVARNIDQAQLQFLASHIDKRMDTEIGTRVTNEVDRKWVVLMEPRLNQFEISIGMNTADIARLSGRKVYRPPPTPPQILSPTGAYPQMPQGHSPAVSGPGALQRQQAQPMNPQPQLMRRSQNGQMIQIQQAQPFHPQQGHQSQNNLLAQSQALTQQGRRQSQAQAQAKAQAQAQTQVHGYHAAVPRSG